VEHRDRKNTIEDRKTSVATTIGAMTTALVALAAVIALRLPYDRLVLVDEIALGVAAVAVVSVATEWLNALYGSLGFVLATQRTAVEDAAEVYESVLQSLSPIEVRAAMLERLLAEEALANRELDQRQGALRQATLWAVVALLAPAVVATHFIWF
jgi:hypothetical protein